MSRCCPCFMLISSSHFRFGEEPLHSCEVMLHDIDSSKRLNTAVMSEIRSKRMNNSPNDEVNKIIFSLIFFLLMMRCVVIGGF